MENSAQKPNVQSTPTLEERKALAVRILDAIISGKIVCVDHTDDGKRSWWQRIEGVGFSNNNLIGYIKDSSHNACCSNLCDRRISVIEFAQNEIEIINDKEQIKNRDPS